MHWNDLEYEIMKYCLRREGKWWANHYFRNKEVNDLYYEILKLPLEQTQTLIQRGMNERKHKNKS